MTGPTLRRSTRSSSQSMTATASLKASECAFHQSNWVTVMRPTVSAPASSGRSVSSDTSPVLCARRESGGFLPGGEDLAHDGGSSAGPFLDGVGVHREGEGGIGMAEEVGHGPDVHADRVESYLPGAVGLRGLLGKPTRRNDKRPGNDKDPDVEVHVRPADGAQLPPRRIPVSAASMRSGARRGSRRSASSMTCWTTSTARAVDVSGSPLGEVSPDQRCSPGAIPSVRPGEGQRRG